MSAVASIIDTIKANLVKKMNLEDFIQFELAGVLQIDGAKIEMKFVLGC